MIYSKLFSDLLLYSTAESESFVQSLIDILEIPMVSKTKSKKTSNPLMYLYLLVLVKKLSEKDILQLGPNVNNIDKLISELNATYGYKNHFNKLVDAKINQLDLPSVSVVAPTKVETKDTKQTDIDDLF